MPRDVVSLAAWRASHSPALAAELVEVGKAAAPLLAKLAEMGDGRGIVRVAEAVVAVANGNAPQAHELVEDLLLEARAGR